MNEEQGRRVMVTGHDGYVGAVLCPKLVEAGYDVVGLDTCYYEGCTFGVAGRKGPAIRKDVRDVTPDDLNGFDAVIHLAALSNDPVGALDPDLTLKINYAATIRLARAARAAGVRRFLFASSCSIYGMTGEDWVDEGSPLGPLTAYAQSKVRAEKELLTLGDERFAPVILRCATVYGISTKLRVDLVVNNLSGWGVTHGQVRILSDGTPWRPLVHVEDLARAYCSFLAAPQKEVLGLVVNVGFDEQNYQVREIAEAVRQAIPGVCVTYAGEGNRDSRSYRVRFARFQKFTGLKPCWTLESGARQLVDAFRAAPLTREEFSGPKFTRLHHVRALLSAGRLDGELRWTPE